MLSFCKRMFVKGSKRVENPQDVVNRRGTCKVERLQKYVSVVILLARCGDFLLYADEC